MGAEPPMHERSHERIRLDHASSSRALLGAVLVAVVGGGGCASVNHVHAPLSQIQLDEIQKSIEDREVTVTVVVASAQPSAELAARAAAQRVLRGPARLDWNTLHIDGDEPVAVPLAAVRKINTNHAVAGAFNGAFVGFLVGAVLGGVLGYTARRDCSPNETFCFSRGTTAVVGALAMAQIAVPVGAVIGGMRGHGPIWVFE
jgi:hypothetical protein